MSPSPSPIQISFLVPISPALTRFTDFPNFTDALEVVLPPRTPFFGVKFMVRVERLLHF